MSEAEAREFLASIAYVPGQSSTAEPRFSPETKPRAEREAARELVGRIKRACRVIFEADCAASVS